MELRERRTDCSYLLYVPSIYTDDRQWPLVVACHGTRPYDTREFQMREWAKFAEYEGIIVAAPSLVSTKGDFPPPPEKQIRLQNTDEAGILAMVSEIKRRYKIAEEQAFLTGWSAGAYPMLHVGLKHPDVFRAIFIRQGTFDERFMDIPDHLTSRWQPIKVVYGKTDFLRDQTRASIAWLRDRGLWVEEQEIVGIHRRIDPRRTWQFFQKIVKERPWVRLRTLCPDPSSPLTVRFFLDAIPAAVKQKWLFGDDETSYEPSPMHTYARPGRYEVRVNVAVESGKAYTRTKTLTLSSSPGGSDADDGIGG